MKNAPKGRFSKLFINAIIIEVTHFRKVVYDLKSHERSHKAYLKGVKKRIPPQK